MDIATHAAGSLNGIDLLLWIGLMYIAPRLLRLRPRRQAQARVHHAPRRLRPAVIEKRALKVA